MLDKNRPPAQNSLMVRKIPNLDRLLGIHVEIHYTWAFAFLLIIVVVVTQFPETYAIPLRITLGVAAAVLYFLAVNIRQSIISYVALHRGVPLKHVTLFAFVGIPQIAEKPTKPVLETLIAVVGLLTNLLITAIFYFIYLILMNAGDIIITGVIQWSAFICLMLALFHFIPGYPLDGGRLLRAIMWRASGNYERATRFVSWFGKGTGFLFIAGGLAMMVIQRQWLAGLALIFVGWVLLYAGSRSRRHAALGQALEHLNARDIMTGEYHTVSPQLTLERLIHDYILVKGSQCFIVADDSRFQGIICLHDIKPVPKKRWKSTRVRTVMKSANKIKSAHPGQSALNLLEQMDEQEVDQIPVLEEDKVVGIIAKDRLRSLVKTRSELKL